MLNLLLAAVMVLAPAPTPDPSPGPAPPGWCVPDCATDQYDQPNLGRAPLTVPPEGRKLSYDEVAKLAHSVGVPDDQLATAVAVAAGESSHFTAAHNPNGDDDSYGLWQTNFHGYLGPARLAKYRLTEPKDTYVPEVSARIMMDMSGQGKDWSPWGAYTNGSYEKWLYDSDRAAWNTLNPDKPQFPDKVQEWGVQ